MPANIQFERKINQTWIVIVAPSSGPGDRGLSGIPPPLGARVSACPSPLPGLVAVSEVANEARD